MNLILVRHAKSSWDTNFTDKERPLAQRGLNDAELLSSHLKDLIPEDLYFLCSSAKRTTETALIFAKKLLFPTNNIVFKDDLYTFNSQSLEHIIRSVDDTHKNVIIFGHNNAITDFVNKFGDRRFDNVPTCGFVFMQFDVDNWNSISEGTVIKAVLPKDLRG